MEEQKQAQVPVAPAKDLGTMFRSMNKQDQDLAIHYFNLHNAAIWLYSSASEDAKEYINTAIAYSVEYKENQIKNESTNV